MEICEHLRSHVCLVQCPPSFVQNRVNTNNLRGFFKRIPRDRVKIIWEPRHKTWHSNPQLVRQICQELDLVHGVDILKRAPQSSGELSYIRLHGLPSETSYKYSYTDEDLRNLLQRVEELETKTTYVMFNNMTMVDDCLRFKALVAGSPAP